VANTTSATALRNKGKKRRKWKRSDRLSLAAVIAASAACVIAAIQPGAALWHWLHKAGVSITYPANDESMPNNTFGAWGTAANIPPSSDLWLIVRSGVEGRYYPTHNLQVVRGHWAIGAGKICPGAGPQDIQVYLVPNTDENDLFAYIRGGARTRNGGMNSVPADAVLEASHQVQVAGTSAKYC
jgi:hypothetical protein